MEAFTAANSLLSPCKLSNTPSKAGRIKAFPRNTDAFFLAGSNELLRCSRAMSTNLQTIGWDNSTTFWKADGTRVRPTWTKDRLVEVCWLLGRESSSSMPPSSTKPSASLHVKKGSNLSLYWLGIIFQLLPIRFCLELRSVHQVLTRSSSLETAWWWACGYCSATSQHCASPSMG